MHIFALNELEDGLFSFHKKIVFKERSQNNQGGKSQVESEKDSYL